MNDDFSFEIVKNFGALSTAKTGWIYELNLVSWGGKTPKYDLRSWSPDHQKMGKGSTFTDDELKALRDLLNSLDLN
ncbi:MAG: PC4/YdbC family ssDNA-binding protein [Treponema sp.]|nr:PC4/YdbC family ssDNA-binding protein [Treponema sp.]